MIGASGMSNLVGFLADQAGFQLAMKTGSIFLVLIVVLLVLKGGELSGLRVRE